MPLPPRLFPGDEELGKRDDDHRPGAKPPISTIWPVSMLWQHRRPPLRKNMKRSGLVLLALFALYFFFKNMPTDLHNPRPRPSYTYTTDAQGKKTWSKAATGPSLDRAGPARDAPVPPSDDDDSDDSKHWFDGPIKFYHLAASLHGLGITRGTSDNNRNVLFAASSLQSAALLLPMACEMVGWKRNHVHFALMGRDDIPMDVLKEVNGVNDCNIFFHDARPDYSVQSSNYRMEVSSSAALMHITNFMHPQAVIVDGSGQEDDYFLPAMKERADRLERTLIELPAHSEQNMKWLNRLDSSSLNAWNRFSVDILIHAQPAASGSLMRLLKSLWKADYFGSAPPRLTIELPHDIDRATCTFLSDTFTWPPTKRSREANANQLTLRHRVPQHGLSTEESSVRFLESFWPANTDRSHVLVLSPNAELSPLYFYYLKYSILEYRYSTIGVDDLPDLLGISLDLPSTYLNDSSTFTPPLSVNDTSKTSAPAPFFLWQAPNSNAALYFGDKWIEFHSFISHSMVSKHTLPTPTTIPAHTISKTYPSWLEHILRLARLRGYRMIYPVLSGPDMPALATTHNELYHPPEEFTAEFGLNIDDDHLDPNTDDFTADPEKHLSLKHTEMPLAATSLLNFLPPDKLLPPVTDMPLLTWDGRLANEELVLDEAYKYRSVFMREIGGCEAKPFASEVAEGTADDLFCLDKDAEVTQTSSSPALPKKTGSVKVQDV